MDIMITHLLNPTFGGPFDFYDYAGDDRKREEELQVLRDLHEARGPVNPVPENEAALLAQYAKWGGEVLPF